MAYTHSKYEVIMQRAAVTGAVEATAVGQGGLNLAVTVAAGFWAPGLVPHIIRGAALVLSSSDAPAANPVVVGIEADISTPGTVTQMFRLSLPTAGAANKSHYYIPTSVFEIKPGMKVQARPTTAATAGVRAHCILYVEPRWEVPGNVTTMTTVTAVPTT